MTLIVSIIAALPVVKILDVHVRSVILKKSVSCCTEPPL